MRTEKKLAALACACAAAFTSAAEFGVANVDVHQGSDSRQVRISYDLKTAVMRAVRQNAADPAGFLAQLHMLGVPQTLYGAILELFSAC